MDITSIQRILNDAVREYDLVANVPHEVFVALISVDLYRKLNAKPVVTARAPAKRKPADQNVPGQMSMEV